MFFESRKQTNHSLLGTVQLMLVLILMMTAGWAQTQTSQPQTTQKKDIPDAPSAVRPPQPFPTAPIPSTPPSDLPDPTAPLPTSNGQPPTQANPAPANAPEPTPIPVTKDTTEEASPAAKLETDSDLYRITRRVNQVIVPVRVVDDAGHRVDDIEAKDFAVYENGKKQTLNYVSVSSVALSVAVVFDLGMPDVAVQKVNRTFSALEGAFSQYDEVAIYTYSSTVARMADFNGVGKKLSGTLEQLKYVSGRNNGPPVMGGPMSQGPVINGVPADPSVPTVQTAPQESHVLNDAILAAALDLSKRDKARRRVIFVISDGREMHSTASYAGVLKVLLTNNIAVYGIEVGGIGVPGYSKLTRIHLPRMGYSNILPKYASATAGEDFPDVSREAIEDAYAHSIGDARNQYTLGYVTPATPSEAYREIEVTVARPGVKVYARDGYYQAPPGR